MGVPSLVDGHLPMGRWVCTPEDVEEAFVASDKGVRGQIWSDWTMLRDALRSALGELPACWMAGSFLSDKPIPGDIDVVWVVDAVRWSQVFNAADAHLRGFLLNCANNGVKSSYHLNVDSFVLEWMPTPGPDRPVGAEPYYGNRGYWDNLWIRVRDADDRLSSIPRRGYLEVILDGYR